jgi:hypothetical protein
MDLVAGRHRWDHKLAVGRHQRLLFANQVVRQNVFAIYGVPIEANAGRVKESNLQEYILIKF